MVLACWQAQICDDAGNIIPNASIEVLRDIAGQPPAQCYSDRDGVTAIGSSFTADSDGFVRFFAAGGAYQITASSGDFSRIWRYVAIGTNAETDAGAEEGNVPDSREIIAGTGLTGGGDLSADRTIAIDKATDANVRAAASDKTLTADLIETASAAVTLTDAATVAVDWDAFIYGELTITANRALGNPTNGQPGTWRTIYVAGNDATLRTLTFGGQFLGDVPTLTDISNAQAYLLTIFCRATTHFVVSAKEAL